MTIFLSRKPVRPSASRARRGPTTAKRVLAPSSPSSAGPSCIPARRCGPGFRTAAFGGSSDDSQTRGNHQPAGDCGVLTYFSNEAAVQDKADLAVLLEA